MFFFEAANFGLWQFLFVGETDSWLVANSILKRYVLAIYIRSRSKIVEFLFES